MSSIKIIYFNTRGRAELSKLIAAAGGLEFEDVRVEGADWPKLKHSKRHRPPLRLNGFQARVNSMYLNQFFDDSFGPKVRVVFW